MQAAQRKRFYILKEQGDFKITICLQTGL